MNTVELLNEEQAAAIESKADRKLVIAGPGSGKTRLLVHAIAAECEGPVGTPFSEILAITFTNSASDELEKRLRRHFLNDDLRLGFCGTLHAFCLKLLREDGGKVGLPQQLSVIDDEQREGLVQQIADEMGINCSLKKALEMLDRKQVGFHATSVPTKEDLVAKEYRLRLQKAGLLDFDSILDYGLKLILKLNLYEWHWSCLYVDELQDASDDDWAIYGAMPCAKKFMVGDPDQAIFGFRGGNAQNMVAAAELAENPKAGRPGIHEVFTLETNYRCGSRLCEAAQSLIEHNTHRFGKATIATHDATQLFIAALASAQDELNWVGHAMSHARDIADIAPDNEHYSRFAILCRTNRLAKGFAQHLAAHGIPVAETKHAYAPPDWKRAKLLLAVLQSPWNDLLVEQYMKLSPMKTLGSFKEPCIQVVKREAALAMTSINEELGWLFGHGDCNPSSLDADLAKHDLTIESRERIHDAAKALSNRANWNLTDLLVFLNAKEESAIETGNGVTVTTIHQAKGREWDCVFLPGWEEGIIPSNKKDSDLEEERRLAYVGMTRARERLFITWCSSRPEWRGPNLPPGPMQRRESSRFIKEAGL